MRHNQIMQKAQISEDRQLMYYGGMILTGIGLFVFISTAFVTSSTRRTPVEVHVSGEDPAFIEQHREMLGIPRETVTSGPPEPSELFARALTGMGIMVLGSILMSIGSKGLAGSGIILSPDKAREDLKPWSHMAGGMLDDALSQSQRVTEAVGGKNEEVVKVRCPSCRALNDDDAKFCDECGTKL
jgi:hypothetical protein